MGKASVPGVLIKEAEKPFQPGASAARHAAVMLSLDALTNLPAELSTAAWGMPPFTAYRYSTKPIAPGVFFTMSAISELRSAGVPTAHLGDGVTPIWARNLELTLERKSVKT